MDDREFEEMVCTALGQDFSAGTDEFLDALLARCLRELDGNVIELDDTALGMLAAAGDSSLLVGKGFPSGAE